MTWKLHEFRLSLLGKDTSPVQSAKDLRVILDSNLTFDDHIKTTVSEYIARLAQICRVKHCLDRTSLLTAINALVFSKLYYCSNVWANTTEKNIRKLQAVQNFACRIVSGARKCDHVTPHLKSLSWLPVKNQLYYRQAIMAFKCISGHARASGHGQSCNCIVSSVLSFRCVSLALKSPYGERSIKYVLYVLYYLTTQDRSSNQQKSTEREFRTQ